MAKYVIVRAGIVENSVEWDGGPTWSPPDGTEAHSFEGVVRIGWQWNDGAPVDPSPPPPEPVIPVPGEVSSGQIILALAELDWLDAVDAAVAQADALSQRLWARASRFPRDDAMLIAIGTAIGKSSDDLDDLFRLAATK